LGEIEGDGSLGVEEKREKDNAEMLSTRRNAEKDRKGLRV
jgi:hypothetical protein